MGKLLERLFAWTIPNFQINCRTFTLVMEPR